ncbi:WD domain-containing protein [Geosmithia morbida]|uniref:WD domain-containing protein n=1 Tax=Geosmithia morbida TaxID=1094350 RepID=A0A9P4YZI8_9HYPO|nr:WD domain-containing protein [Geosmithia morbida]KAF4125946.1 WD domain-containing protein [Geosmithia morbida]
MSKIVTASGATSRARARDRQVSRGTVWTVGGLVTGQEVLDDGQGHPIQRGTHSQIFTSSFFNAGADSQNEISNYHGRVASALEMDCVRKILEFRRRTSISRSDEIYQFSHHQSPSKTTWDGSKWVNDTAKKVLDAPNLRDDFYCSILAYSPTSRTLAIALGGSLYTWSESLGAYPMYRVSEHRNWITSVAFSSVEGGRSILAAGMINGLLILQSTYDAIPRFEIQFPHGEVKRDTWSGTLVLVAKISIHEQQICGIAWSQDGELFASGANDDLCCLFDISDVLDISPPLESSPHPSRWDEGPFTPVAQDTDAEPNRWSNNGRRLRASMNRTSDTDATEIRTGNVVHGAAVKAIAFCPWRPGLIATGGGSSDRCIHFFHTRSGSALATIAVSAQVTSLIWSTTRREIAATLGYSQPDHPYRIAVFRWPECTQVAAIPWGIGLRALHAIPYPTFPQPGNRRNERESSKDHLQGCLVVAASDSSVKFHEIWPNESRIAIGGPGTLAGSDILESIEGIDKEGEIIR